jgi:hypothetical protein
MTYFRVGVSLLSVLLLSACVNESNSDIASISIAGNVCANCSEALWIARDGEIKDMGYPDPMVSFDPNRVADVFKSIPIDELHDAAGRMPTLTSPANVVILVVSYRDGRQERAAVPMGLVAYQQIAELQRWVGFAAFEATDATLANRRRTIETALRRRTMRSIRLEMLGCYGWCPSYAATFNSNGVAVIQDHGPHCNVAAKTRAPFNRVLGAASLAGWLRPYYPIKAVDTPGARIILVTQHGEYVSLAPDRSSWGTEFLETQSRLDQIVRDARWAPAIDLQFCAGETRRPVIDSKSEKAR